MVNWNAIGAIGEIVGAAAVVLSLLYLAIQMRQNTKAQAIATFESAMSGFNEAIRFSFGDIERSSTFRRGTVDPDSLNEDESVLFNAMIRHYSNHIYKLFRLYERGVFPESEWINAVTEAKQLFESDGLARFKTANNYYADLWKEMDRRNTSQISNFDFDVREGRSNDA